MHLKFVLLMLLTLGGSLFLPSVIIGTARFTTLSTATTANSDHSVLISIPSAIKNLNPLFSHSYSDRYVYEAIYQPLFASYNTSTSLYQWQIKPIIARSYSVAPNGTTWTFNIRPGLVWSDGLPLNVSDVLFTYQILMNPEIDLYHYSTYALYFADNSSHTMRILNATQIVFNLLPNSFPANQIYTILDVFSAVIFPKHIFQPLITDPGAWQTDITNTGTGTNRTVTIGSRVIQINGPIGSGPYKYAGYNISNNVCSLVINPTFNAAIQGLKTPSIQTIKFTVLSDFSTALASFNSGAVQVVDLPSFTENIIPSIYPSNSPHPILVNSNDYQELGYNQYNSILGMNPPNQVNFYFPNGTITNTTTQIGWWTPDGTQAISEAARVNNTSWITQEQIAAAGVVGGNISADQWFFDNLNSVDRLKIRLAMDYAIPRAYILNAILNGYGSVSLATWVTPYFSMYDPALQARSYNPSMSAFLLAQVFGYTYNAAATNYTHKTYFTINFLVPNDNPAQILWAGTISSSLISLGINVNSVVTSFNTVLDRTFFNPTHLGADYVHGGWDAVFVGNNLTSSVPDFRSFVQPQDYQSGRNYYLINNSQITAISNWMINQTGPNAVTNATAFQEWCYNNIPSSIIEEDQHIFYVASQLYNFKPTIYQQYNYNEWTFTVEPPASSTTNTFPTFFPVVALVMIVIIAFIGGIILFRRKSDKPVTIDTLEDNLGSSKQITKTSSSAFCPNCGNSILPEDQYCMSCGTKLRT